MSTFRDSAAVVVDVYLTSVLAVVTVFPVIANIQCQAVCNQSVICQLEYQTVCHLHDNDSGFVIWVRAGEHLSFGDTVSAGFVGFDFFNAAGFQTLSMINQQFGINTEFLI